MQSFLTLHNVPVVSRKQSNLLNITFCPYLTLILTPIPLFQVCFEIENQYSGFIRIPEINFSGRTLVECQFYVPTKFTSPPPPQIVVP